MPAPIVINPRQDPWEALLPQLVGNLFLAKIKHGWDMETAAAEIEKQILLSGKFTRTPPKVKEGEPSPVPAFSAGGEKYYRIPIAETPGQTLAKKGRFVVGGQIQQEQPDGTYKPLTQPVPTFSKIEGEAFYNWISDKPTSPKQLQLVDRKLKETGQTPGQVKANAKARIDAKIESFISLMGRPPTANEKRAMIINDPYGILISGSEQGGEYKHTAINAEGQKMGSNDGVNWFRIE